MWIATKIPVILCLYLTATEAFFAFPSISRTILLSPFARKVAASPRLFNVAASLSAGTDQLIEEEIPPLKENPPLKIGLVIEPTPFTHVSGYSNRYQELLKYLNKAEDSVEVVCPDDTSNPPSKFLSFPIFYTPGFRFSLYNSICLSFDYMLVGFRMLRRSRPDVLHVTTPGFMAITSTISAKLLDVPLVLAYHTHLPVYAIRYLGFIPWIDRISWLAIRYVHSQADLTLVTSPQLKAEFEAEGVRGVEVWRKGIDVDTFHPKWRSARARERLTDGNPGEVLLLYVGRLGKEKRLEDLLPLLRRADLPIRLAVVGTGPYEAQLRQAFAGTRTVFTGLLRDEPLWEAFASADLFCMPSDSETLGFVVLESLASGVPVIAAKAGGLPDVVQEGKTGFLFPPGDSAKIESLVRRLIADPQSLQAMGANGRAFAERYSWESSTSVLRNRQYPAALRTHAARRAASSVFVRALQVSALAFVAVWTGLLVGVGCLVDAFIQSFRRPTAAAAAAAAGRESPPSPS